MSLTPKEPKREMFISIEVSQGIDNSVKGGRIVFDGVDIREMDRDEITRIVSYSAIHPRRT